MQNLLRSTFRADQSDDLDLLLANALELKTNRYEFGLPEYQLVWIFVESFVSDHNHVPDFETLLEHFQVTSRNADVVNHLQILRSTSPIYRGNFKKRLAVKLEERQGRQFDELLADAHRINKSGMEIKEGRDSKILKGPRDAASYLARNLQNVTSPVTAIRREGDATNDGEAFLEDYDRRKNDPTFGQGQYSGLLQFDDHFGGARKDQLWTHAGFTGHGKSLFAMNWVYNQSVYFKYSTCYFSLEMPYDQCRRIIYTMHSLHEKFNEIRCKLGIQEDPEVTRGLKYRDIREGELDDIHEKFLKEYVVPDLNDPANHYGNIHFKGYDPDQPHFRVSDVRRKAEILYRENPFSLLVVDHALLLDAKQRHTSQTGTTNEVIRDLKIMSEVFNRGEGMAVLALFQISREGLKRADANNGIYRPYDLSYANEVERSSDIITASYLTQELSRQNKFLFHSIKGRDDGNVDPFYVEVDWNTRRLKSCLEVPEFVQEMNAAAEQENTEQEKLYQEIENTPYKELGI